MDYRLLMPLFLTGLLLCLPQSTRAQLGVQWQGQGKVKLTGFGDVNVDRTARYWAARKRAQIQQELNSHIGLLQANCKLEESQIDKLKWAARGVIAARLSTGEEQLRTFILNSGLAERKDDEAANDEDGNDENEAKEEPQYDDVLTMYGASNVANNVVKIESYFAKPATQHPRWKKIVNNTLRDDQKKKIKEFLTRRNRSFAEIAAHNGMAELGIMIELTKEQRSDFIEFAMTRLDKKITDLSPTSVAAADTLFKRTFRNQNAFNHLLTEEQRETVENSEPIRNRGTVRWGSPPTR